MTVEIVKSSGCDLRMQKACDRNMAAIGNLRVCRVSLQCWVKAEGLTWGRCSLGQVFLARLACSGIDAEEALAVAL